MKLTFYSNFLNHHQIPLCDEFYKILGDDFCFVATEPIDKERLELGYKESNSLFPYCLPAYLTPENLQKAINLAVESDVVIHGSAPTFYLTERMKLNKVTFKYTERLFKKWYYYFMPGFYRLYRRYTDMNLFFLCAGGFVYKDLKLISRRIKGCFRWGYFPEFLPNMSSSKCENKPIELLWCGRMIKFKRPEKVIYLANELKREKIEFHLTIIGTGDYDRKIKKIIAKKNLEEYITWKGALPAENVRGYMMGADIFICTSNRFEGWGAVLNEAMNSRCAIVAYKNIGSVPFLIKPGINGLTFSNNYELYQCVKRLINDKALRNDMSYNNYKVIQKLWNAEIAAQRFITLSNALINGKAIPDYEDGPCSKID